MNMAEEIQIITSFIKSTFEKTQKPNLVIGISGGIDSATALTLATQALGKEHVYPILMPYGDQDILDGMEICRFNSIPADNIQMINIKTTADECINTICHSDLAQRSQDQDLLPTSDSELDPWSGQNDMNKIRLGNVMARLRMVVLFDQAKKLNALVCGTENKSEKYLGYYTRFGDEASDLEPIQHLYKTQIWELARDLGIPEKYIEKAPTAGLWDGQTDEQELGFTYEQADKVLEQLIDMGKKEHEIEGVETGIVQKITEQVKSQQFKHEVPYHVNS